MSNYLLTLPLGHETLSNGHSLLSDLKKTTTENRFWEASWLKYGSMMRLFWITSISSNFASADHKWEVSSGVCLVKYSRNEFWLKTCQLSFITLLQLKYLLFFPLIINLILLDEVPHIADCLQACIDFFLWKALLFSLRGGKKKKNSPALLWCLEVSHWLYFKNSRLGKKRGLSQSLEPKLEWLGLH